MQLVVHTGAHFTEEGRLIKCLLRNKDAFRPEGVVVPGPGKYRKILRQTLAAMARGALAPEAREVLLDIILDGEAADRVILSNAYLFGAPRAVIGAGGFYPDAPQRVADLVRLFPTEHVELFMAVRDPATFIPACFQVSSHNSLAEFLEGADPRTLRWSDTFFRIREAAPEVPVTVWCNEDAPMLWAQVVREMAGLGPGEKVIGGFELVGDIISEQGMERFETYIGGKPDLTEIQMRRVIAAFLERFAIEEKIAEEIDLPGWTEDLVAELGEIYDEDMIALARIPGVTLISP